MKKKFEEEYAKYSDEEFCEILCQEAEAFAIISKSEKYAKQILEEHKVAFYPLYNDFKEHFILLVAYAKKRGIAFPRIILKNEIDKEDIIERLLEQESKALEELEEYCNLHHNGFVSLLPISKEEYTNNIHDLFESIIEDVEKSDISSLKKPKKKKGKRYIYHSYK